MKNPDIEQAVMLYYEKLEIGTSVGRITLEVKQTATMRGDWHADKDCYACGKNFVLTGQLKDYVYKKYIGSKLKYFCSWTCLRATETTERKKK